MKLTLYIIGPPATMSYDCCGSIVQVRNNHTGQANRNVNSHNNGKTNGISNRMFVHCLNVKDLDLFHVAFFYFVFFFIITIFEPRPLNRTLNTAHYLRILECTIKKSADINIDFSNIRVKCIIPYCSKLPQFHWTLIKTLHTKLVTYFLRSTIKCKSCIALFMEENESSHTRIRVYFITHLNIRI